MLEQFGPSIPRLSPADLAAVLAESERPIRAWLDRNEAYVRGLSLAAATAEVMRRVPEAAEQGAGDVAGTIRNWARERGISMRTVSIVPHAADAAPSRGGGGGGFADSDLVRAVEGAVRAVHRGIRVERSHGFAHIRVSGATVGLRARGRTVSGTITPSGGVRVRAEGGGGFAEVSERGATIGTTGSGARVRAGVSWSGEMRLATSYRNFHLSMSLSAASWSLQLSFPSRDMPADLSALGGIFGSGEAALRSALGEVAGFRSLDDIPDIAGRVEPHVTPVRRAVEAATRIARTRRGVSFGVRAEGPGPGAGSGGTTPTASRVFGVLTVVF